MIRRATADDMKTFRSETPRNEAALRIGGLASAYGTETAFLQIWRGEDGGMLSLMDGVAVFYAPEQMTEEWPLFLTMQPNIRILRTDRTTAEKLPEWEAEKTGVTLRLDGEPPENGEASADDSPRMLFPVLERCFPECPPFDGWYVDVSHRMRHGCCHAASVRQAEETVAVAMTVAETERAALLGFVATREDHRRKGYAAMCLGAVIRQIPGKTVYINPVNEPAHRLYCRLGFVPDSEWAQLKRPGT